MITSRPSTMPMPLTIPAPGTSPPYSVLAASVESSRNGVPGSSNNSIRSRTNILFCRDRRSRSRAGRSRRTARWRSSSVSASARLCLKLSRNSSDEVSILLSIRRIARLSCSTLLLGRQCQKRRTALKRLADADMDGGDYAVAPCFDRGFELHALDHHQGFARRRGLSLVHIDRDDHAGHRRLGDIVGTAAGMAAVALHRIDITDGKGHP